MTILRKCEICEGEYPALTLYKIKGKYTCSKCGRREKGELLTTKGWRRLRQLEEQRILELIDQLKEDIKSGKVLEE